MKYDTWTTGNLRDIHIFEMNDDHVINCIRDIENGKLFPHYGETEVVYMGFENGDVLISETKTLPQACYDEQRDNWLTVFKGEALQRGLDWSDLGVLLRRIDLVVDLCNKILTERKFYV